MCQVFSGYGQELGPILSTIQQKLRSDRLIQLRIGFLESQHFPVCIWKALGRCCGNVWACLNFDRIWSFAFWGDHFLSPESQKKKKDMAKAARLGLGPLRHRQIPRILSLAREKIGQLLIHGETVQDSWHYRALPAKAIEIPPPLAASMSDPGTRVSQHSQHWHFKLFGWFRFHILGFAWASWCKFTYQEAWCEIPALLSQSIFWQMSGFWMDLLI